MLAGVLAVLGATWGLLDGLSLLGLDQRTVNRSAYFRHYLQFILFIEACKKLLGPRIVLSDGKVVVQLVHPHPLASPEGPLALPTDEHAIEGWIVPLVGLGLHGRVPVAGPLGLLRLRDNTIVKLEEMIWAHMVCATSCDRGGSATLGGRTLAFTIVSTWSVTVLSWDSSQYFLLFAMVRPVY